MSWKKLDQRKWNEINQLMLALKNHDQETFEHCLRVSQLSQFLAMNLELSSEEILQARLAGLLHDVGKMMIPLEVLNKPGKLDDKEYELMQKHADFSGELMDPLVDSPFLQEIQNAVIYHHERVDGKGYPLQLQGEQVPFLSRVILVVDTVDAMTQTRAYRKGLALPVVYQELEKYAGQQFDEDIVPVFIESYKRLIQKPSQAVLLDLSLGRKKKAA